MTRKTYDILYTVTEHLNGEDFGLCCNICVHDLYPEIVSNKILDGPWLFYRSSINEIFYYTGVPCDLVYTVARCQDKFVYLYRLE